jgi:protein ImuA
MMLAARIMAKARGPVIWIRPGWGAERLNAAGLQPLADPARLILVESPRDEGLLWATEEALRSGAAPLVVTELLTPPALTPIRRLHLAAEAGAAAARREGLVAPVGLLLLPGQGGAQGVESRWHMAPAPSRSLLWSDEDSFTLTRLRARLLPPASWAWRSRATSEMLEPQALADI